MCSASGHVIRVSGSSLAARKSKHSARRLAAYLSGIIPWAERAVRGFPVPAIPTPYIHNSFIPLSTKLLAWLWFLRYTSLLIGSLVEMRAIHAFELLFPYAATAVVVTLSYCLSPFHPQQLQPSTVLWFLAWAGHIAQTVHNSLEIARAADIFDFVLILVLFAVVLRYTRSDSRHFMYPLNFKRAPYIANRASQIAHIAFAARRSPSIYLGLPLLLLGILVIFRVMRKRDQRRRVLVGPNSNSLNPAACIPPEVQLRIFHLVRTRRRFFERDTPAFPGTTYLQELRPIGIWTRPAAGCTVCRAWRDAATEVLYSDIFLPNSKSVHAFLAALDAQPALSPLVRRIALSVSENIPSHAVERIVSSCDLATEFAFFNASMDVSDIPGLALTAHRVRRLAITWGDYVPAVDNPAYNPRECDIVDAIERFPCLESLELRGVRIPWSDDVSIADVYMRLRFSELHTLRLDACVISIRALIELMLVLTTVRVVSLRNMVVPEDHLLGADVAFTGLAGTLTELDLSSTHARLAPPPVAPRTLGGFTALRTLALDAHALRHLRELPPALERLVLSFAPYSIMLRHTRRQRLFLTVDRLRRLLALAPPSLRSVQIWDEANLAHTRDWAVAAFMLREMLGPSIDVEVNISLPRPELLWWRLRLSAQKSFRWLYDT